MEKKITITERNGLCHFESVGFTAKEIIGVLRCEEKRIMNNIMLQWQEDKPRQSELRNQFNNTAKNKYPAVAKKPVKNKPVAKKKK